MVDNEDDVRETLNDFSTSLAVGKKLASVVLIFPATPKKSETEAPKGCCADVCGTKTRAAKKAKEMRQSKANILKRLRMCGLTIERVGDERIQVYASPRRLMREAVRTGHRFELDAEMLRELDEDVNLRLARGGLPFDPMNIVITDDGEVELDPSKEFKVPEENDLAIPIGIDPSPVLSSTSLEDRFPSGRRCVRSMCKSVGYFSCLDCCKSEEAKKSKQVGCCERNARQLEIGLQDANEPDPMLLDPYAHHFVSLEYEFNVDSERRAPDRGEGLRLFDTYRCKDKIAPLRLVKNYAPFNLPLDRIAALKMLMSIITSDEKPLIPVSAASMKGASKEDAQKFKTQPKHSAGLELDRLVAKKRLEDWFVPHDRRAVDSLLPRWMDWTRLPHEQPFDRIRAYFGEKVAFYFAFLAYYTSSLPSLGLIGLAAFVSILIYGSPALVPFIPLMAIATAIWAAVFISGWRRRRSLLALRWGVYYGLEEVKEPRPEYGSDHMIVKRVRSPVSGKAIMFDNPRGRAIRNAIVSTILILAFGIVAGLVVAAVVLKVDVQNSVPNSMWGSVAGSMLFSLQITILNQINPRVATWLAQMEHHRYVEDFQNSELFKRSVLSICNTFGALFYIGLVKTHLNQCEGGDCVEELAFQVATVFIVGIIQGNILELGKPAAMAAWRRFRGTSTVSKARVDTRHPTITVPNPLDPSSSAAAAPKEEEGSGAGASGGGDVELGQTSPAAAAPAEAAPGGRKAKSAVLDENEYEVTFNASGLSKWLLWAAYDGEVPQEGQIRKRFDFDHDDGLEEPNLDAEFQELVVQFGYVVLFGVVFPLAMLIAYINNYLEIRIDATKIIAYSQRPSPGFSDGIGGYLRVFNFMANLSVIVNVAIICLNPNTDIFGISDLSTAGRFGMFILATIVIFMIKFLSDELAPDVHPAVTLQVQRYEYLHRKLIEHELDDDEFKATLIAQMSGVSRADLDDKIVSAQSVSSAALESDDADELIEQFAIDPSTLGKVQEMQEDTDDQVPGLIDRNGAPTAFELDKFLTVAGLRELAKRKNITIRPSERKSIICETLAKEGADFDVLLQAGISRDGLNAWFTAEGLKKVLRQKALRVSGSKAEKIERLAKAMNI